MQNISKLVSFIIIALFIISAFVCLICNFVINKKLDWSLCVIGSLVLSWLIIIPIIYFKKNGLLLSMGALTIGIIPYLFLIQYSFNIKQLMPIGIPIAIASVIYLWIILVLFGYTNINKWYLSSFTLILTIVLNIIINIVMNNFNYNKWTVVNMIFSGTLTFIAAIIVFYIGFKKNV